MKRLLVNMPDVEQVMEGLGFDTWELCATQEHTAWQLGGQFYLGQKVVPDRAGALDWVARLSKDVKVLVYKFEDSREGTRVFVVFSL